MGTLPASATTPAEAGAFLRFLFQKMFHRTSLLAVQGDPYLKKLIKDQLIHETALEKDFYLEYRAYREYLYTTILANNPDFKGTRGSLVRLTQRFLDRCLFLFFCEDMGKSLDFPDNLLRDILINHSKDAYYNPDDNIPWDPVYTSLYYTSFLVKTGRSVRLNSW